MKRLYRRFVRNLVEKGDLTITFADGASGCFGNGSGVPVHVRFNSSAAEAAILADPALKLGECYMDGGLELVEGDIYRLLEIIYSNAGFDLGANLARARPWQKLLDQSRWLATMASRGNDLIRSRRNVHHHYDLSRSFYELFLDSDKQYSCAYFEASDMTLDEAQLAKKRHIAAKLRLNGEDTSVLDIGCGWGGMGLYLAKNFNVSVTGITLSEEQLAVAKQRAAEENLGNQVQFHLKDYRDVERQFDRIVSVGMFEHVGLKNYGEFFAKVREILTVDGVMLLHFIGQIDPPSPTNPFIEKYIFPGGYIPALSEVISPIERQRLYVTDIEVLRLHYAETLRHWRERFVARWDEAQAMYDERFCRMWEFYLAASEAAFRWQGLVVYQLQIAKDVGTVPLTRDYIGQSEDKQRHLTSMVMTPEKTGGL